MASVSLRFSADELEDMALVDIAYEILRSTNEPVYFRDMMQEVSNIRELTEEESMAIIARLYTEINMDGRFLCIGNNIWGLKRWYPVDKTMDKNSSAKHFFRKDLEEDYYDDDEDEDLSGFEEADDEDFDKFNEDDDAEVESDFDIAEDEEEIEEEIEEESLEELGEEEAAEEEEEEEF